MHAVQFRTDRPDSGVLVVAAGDAPSHGEHGGQVERGQSGQRGQQQGEQKGICGGGGARRRRPFERPHDGLGANLNVISFGGGGRPSSEEGLKGEDR